MEKQPLLKRRLLKSIGANEQLLASLWLGLGSYWLRRNGSLSLQVDRQLERSLLDGLANDPLLQAASADINGAIGTVWGRDLDALQVWLELTTGDAGDLRTNTAQVLSLTTGLDLITHALFLVAKLALSHRSNSLTDQPM